MIGTVLSNRYKLIAELGSGGMAWVYLAQDLVGGHKVAVKVLYPQHSRDLGFLQRFSREARLSMTLSQPPSQQNIVRVLDYGADRDTHYLVMEYVPGQDLGHLLAQEGPLSWPKALDIARQVALALDHAARLEIVHRDIKPSNIMVCPDASVKVLDFGIARARSSPHLTLVGYVGSPHYAAPEQATGLPVDGRADVYSLGVVLYRMLSGELPFQGDTPWAVVNQHIVAEPPELAEIRAGLPTPVVQLVEKAMAKRAGDRFQTPEEFVHAIDAVASGLELPFDPVPSTVAWSALEVEALYGRAKEAIESESWHQAVDLLSQIIKVDPGYEDVTEQLAEVSQQIRLANLYRAVHRALDSRQWDRALTQLDRIAEADPAYKDIADLREKALNKERPQSLSGSPTSEFPTQVPPADAEDAPAQDALAVRGTSVARSPVDTDLPRRRQRILWAGIVVVGLILALALYFGLMSARHPAEITDSISQATPSLSVQASATSSSPTSVAGIPQATAASSSTPTPTRSPVPALAASPSPSHTSPPSRTPLPTATLTTTPTPTPTPSHTPAPSATAAAALPRTPTGQIAFPRFDRARGTYDVHVCRADGSRCARVVEGASQPDFLPNGTQLVVHSWRPDDKGLIVLSLSGQRIWEISDQLEAARPSVDLRGEWYVYHSRNESDRQPRLFRTYNAESRPILREASMVLGQSPSWTPDRRILYSGCLVNSCGIIVMQADGTFPRQVVAGGRETNPEASPDGQQVAFMSERDGNWEIYVVDIDGGNLRQLTRIRANDGLPTWSPDGRQIAFVTDREGPWAVWTMRPDGTEQRRLFEIGGPLEGQVFGAAPHEIHGWVEERISWGP